MEKLQAALDQARKKRVQGEGQLSASQKRAPQTMQRRSGVSVAEEWAALAPMELSDSVLEKHRIVTQGANSLATPFDILRTKILVQMRKNGWRRLAITSPMPQSGKTTTSCNLALGFGRQSDLLTALLDFDLRSAAMHRYFGVNAPHNVGEMLSGDVSFSNQALRVGKNVAVSMSNSPEHDPTRLLLSEQTASALDQIEAIYKPEIMIFDLPSVLVNDDTRAFLKNVDCALIVVRAGETRYGQFDTCEREIAEQTNVLGVLLNAFSFGNETAR